MDRKEYWKQYYTKNKEHILETNRQWVKSHKKESHDIKNKWRSLHPRVYTPEQKLMKRVYSKRASAKRKVKVLQHYSPGLVKCARCGIEDITVLTIDHINGRGGEERLRTGSSFYQMLISQGFPEGYQVLCFNCNYKKYLEGS